MRPGFALLVPACCLLLPEPLRLVFAKADRGAPAVAPRLFRLTLVTQVGPEVYVAAADAATAASGAVAEAATAVLEAAAAGTTTAIAAGDVAAAPTKVRAAVSRAAVTPATVDAAAPERVRATHRWVCIKVHYAKVLYSSFLQFCRTKWPPTARALAPSADSRFVHIGYHIVALSLPPAILLSPTTSRCAQVVAYHRC